MSDFIADNKITAPATNFLLGIRGVLIDYRLLTLESGFSALGEAHHPFDRILAR